jgi:predicted ABC-type ATPase
MPAHAPHFNPAELRDPHGKWSRSGRAASALHRMGREAAAARSGAAGHAAKDSMAAHTLPDGSFTPERKALHDTIINGILAGHKPQRSPAATFYGGGPASGKTDLKPAAGDSAVIDPDAVKAQLPEYQAMTKAKDPAAAAYVHEESSHVAKEAMKEARRRKINYVLDGTGDSSYAKMAGKVNAARDAGYTVHGRYVTVDTDEAVKRARARAQKTGRMVPEPVIRETHASVSSVFDQAAKSGLFDSVQLFDNSTPMGSPAKLIATGQGSKLTQLDPAAYRRFLAKANERKGRRS